MEHKATMKEFKTYLGIENALRIKIKEAVNTEWLEAIKNPTLGFTALTPMQMLTHLHGIGSDLNIVDVTDIM